MKIVLISLLTATLLGLAFFLGDFSFDIGLFISGCFVASLMAWTIAQYRRKSRLLIMPHLIRVPVRLVRPEAQTSPKFTRLAA
jgi:hypothetical protein